MKLKIQPVNIVDHCAQKESISLGQVANKLIAINDVFS